MGARVLIVEDNRASLDLMLYLLRAFGHEVDGHTSGAEGLEAVQATAYDMILCDILMPDIDGYEFLRRYRSDPNLPDVTIVAVTALAMVGDREKILAAGFDGYIAKPIEPETFVSQVEAFTASHGGPPSAHATAAATARDPGEDAAPVILVVDDIPVNIDVIASSLRPFGYRIEEAGSADEAIAKAQELKPAMILSDLHMPGQTGFHLLKAVRSSPELSDTPFYFISSTVWQTSEKILAYQLGVDKFLLRPIDPQALREEVDHAVRGRNLADDPDR